MLYRRELEGGNPMIKICNNCGKEFKTSDRTQKYCSISCRGKSCAGNKNPGWSGGRKKKKCVTCGKDFLFYPSTDPRGTKRFCSMACYIKNGESNPKWKGGHCDRKDGRRYIYCPSHPGAINGKYVLEYRLVVESKIGRVLSPDEVVHHIDGDPTNNSIENLEVLTSSEHRKLHHKERNN